jgi:glycosyltransferase involved in cell wall biosynthesis
MSSDVCVLILTYNEERNIAEALQSVVGWASQVIVVDSFSQDRTVEIARKFPCIVVQHAFQSYSDQRNWSLTEAPVRCEWVLFLDADERVPSELRDEIMRIVESRPMENGFCIGYRYIWMGKPVFAYGNATVTRLFRRNFARCEQRPINERIVIEGATGLLQHRFIHDDHKDVTSWVQKHIKYAGLEAKELTRKEVSAGYVGARFFGSIPERRRWLRYRVYNRLPVLVRAFVLFVYHYLIRGGFLGGRRALIFYTLHSLWYPLLIDTLFLERADASIASMAKRRDQSVATKKAQQNSASASLGESAVSGHSSASNPTES